VVECPAKKFAKKSTNSHSQKSKKPVKKRYAPKQVSKLVEDVEASKKKRMRKNMSFAEKYEHFLQKSAVRDKVVKVSYFQEQGLGLFLEKLVAQGWLDLFTNTKKGCFDLDLVEFYANCVVTNGVVTSTVNGHKLRFNAKELGKILGMPSEGFDVYVCEV